MGPPVLQLIKLLFDPDVSKKMILQLAYKQIQIIGFAKVLGILLSGGIVGVSSIIKIPQIRKIINPKLLEQRVSVANGLSLPGISLESFVYLVHVLYNKLNNNPFIGYGETLLLGLQNVAIILLIEYYRARERGEDQMGAIVELARPIGVIAGAIILLSRVLPVSVINGLQVLNIPLSITSKLPQIKRNHDLQSTSHLSNVTVGANVVGSFIRVLTTLQNFDKLGRDYVLLAGYGSSFLLNTVIAGQCYFYKKQKED